MFRTDDKISPTEERLLSFVPFLCVLAAYLGGSYYLHHQDALGVGTTSPKLMPLPSAMWEGLVYVSTSASDYQLWRDTYASMQLFLAGMALSFVGIPIGLLMGVFPRFEALGNRFLTFTHKTPVLLLMFLLMCWLGIDGTAKVALIFLGVVPGVVLDAYLQARNHPRKEFYKSQTLRASEWEIAFSIVLPQIFPQCLNTLRLSLNAGLCWLIASEGLSASEGIAYRINKLSHHLQMDQALPYIIWATALAFFMDYLMQVWIRSFRWFGGK